MSPWNLLIKGMLPFSLCPEKAASVSQMSSTELERPLCSLCCHTDQDLVLGSLPQVALLERRVGPDDPKDPLQPQPCCDFVTACFSRAGELALLCSKKAAQAVTLCPQMEVRRCVSDYSLGSDVTRAFSCREPQWAAAIKQQSFTKLMANFTIQFLSLILKCMILF